MEDPFKYKVKAKNQKNQKLPWREVVQGVCEDAAGSLGGEEGRGCPQVFLQVRYWESIIIDIIFIIVIAAINVIIVVNRGSS